MYKKDLHVGQLVQLRSQIDYVDKLLSKSGQYNNPLLWRQELINAPRGILSEEFRITNLDLPLEMGGSGFTHTEMAKVFAWLGEKDLDLRDVPGLGHARIILCSHNKANATQQSLIQSVVDGESFLAVAITEENAGSDIHAISTTAVKTMGGYKINGKKMYVARLSNATEIVVFAKLQSHHPESLTAFIVPVNADGLTIDTMETMGLKGISFGSAIFDNVIIPRENRVGDEGEGLFLFGRHFTYWRLAMAAAAIGCARKALKDAALWLINREAFSKPIGRFTHLQQDLSIHITHLKMAWLLTESIMNRIDQNQPSFVEACSTKAESVEIALAATDWSMRIHGARGYIVDTGLEKRHRDLMGLRIADGALDVLRGQVARAVLGEDIYELSLGRHLEEPNPKPDLTLDELLE